MIVSEEDRKKAAFLAEYRALCERYSLFVVHITNPDNEYSPFSIVHLDEDGRPAFELSIQEMLLEDTRRIRK